MLREELLEKIRQTLDEKCEGLREQVRAVRGDVTARDESLLDAYRAVEAIRLEAAATIEEKGLMESYSNGRQRLTRESKAVSQLLKAAACAARILATLLPIRKARTAAMPDESGGDADDDLDEY